MEAAEAFGEIGGVKSLRTFKPNIKIRRGGWCVREKVAEVLVNMVRIL